MFKKLAFAMLCKFYLSLNLTNELLQNSCEYIFAAFQFLNFLNNNFWQEQFKSSF